MTILVTGGAGFIGSHTCLELLNKGYKVYVIDSCVNSSFKSLERVKEILEIRKSSNFNNLNFFKGDLRDKILLQKVFDIARNNGDSINSVIHFAGLKSVEESVLNPISYWDGNVNSTIKLLEVMEQNNCYSIVFSSSAAIYGIANEKVKEDFIIKPINPYGSTKYAIEEFLFDLHRSFSSKWRIANLRYFNPIGAHETGFIGEDPLNKPNNLFPYICSVANGKYDLLNIFGKDWPTNDGTGVRDYIHVMDLAEGHIKTLEFLTRNEPQAINLNLGTGTGTSVLELINIFKGVSKVDIPYKFAERRKGDSAYVVADNSLAKELLNWEPKRNLKDMCKDGWRWVKLNPNGYQK